VPNKQRKVQIGASEAESSTIKVHNPKIGEENKISYNLNGKKSELQIVASKDPVSQEVSIHAASIDQT
jgi:hypothetical protein